jgi:hypothetical protein
VAAIAAVVEWNVRGRIDWVVWRAEVAVATAFGKLRKLWKLWKLWTLWTLWKFLKLRERRGPDAIALRILVAALEWLEKHVEPMGRRSGVDGDGIVNFILQLENDGPDGLMDW